MAITDTQKVDLLWKKIGFNKAKTDLNQLIKIMLDNDLILEK